MHPDLSKSSKNSLLCSNMLFLLLEGLEELSLHPAAVMERGWKYPATSHQIPKCIHSTELAIHSFTRL